LPGVAAGEHAKAWRWKLVRDSDPSDTNSPYSPPLPGDSEQTSANSPDEIIIESITYHVSGEFGEFHPATPDSREEISSQVVTADLSEPADQPSADVHASTDVENGIQLEMPMAHVITPSGEAQQEVWKRAHLVRRGDRQHGSVVGSRR
jgi:hypothetical protein